VVRKATNKIEEGRNEFVKEIGTVINVKYKDQLCFATAAGEHSKPHASQSGPYSFRHTLRMQPALMQLPRVDAKNDNQSAD
jgi:hypothetical protein